MEGLPGPYNLTGPEEGPHWSLYHVTRGRVGLLELQGVGPTPSDMRYRLSSHCLQKQCHKEKAFTDIRGLNNLSFMTYPEGILYHICLLFSFGMFFLCCSGISKLSSTDLTSPVRNEQLSLLRNQWHANLNQVSTSQSPWSVNPSLSFSIASPSSSEKTGSPSCCFFECKRYERKENKTEGTFKLDYNILRT